jgi:hypothetical protein
MKNRDEVRSMNRRNLLKLGVASAAAASGLAYSFLLFLKQPRFKAFPAPAIGLLGKDRKPQVKKEAATATNTPRGP